MSVWEVLQSVRWELKTGDPTLLGWVTVVAYLLAAGLCARVAWRAGELFPKPVKVHRLIWTLLALGALFLGVNKQLDLQTWMTNVLRSLAYEQGWYEQRDGLQSLFIFAFALGALGLIAALAWLLRRTWRRYWLLLLGILFLARFIMVRAAGFFGVRLPELSRFTGGIRINGILEILGAVCIAAAAWINLRSKADPERTQQTV